MDDRSKIMLDETEYEYKDFSSWYDIVLEIAKHWLTTANMYKNIFKQEISYKDIAKDVCLKFDEEKNEYVIDEIAIKARAYSLYNKGLLHHPQTLKKD